MYFKVLFSKKAGLGSLWCYEISVKMWPKSWGQSQYAGPSSVCVCKSCDCVCGAGWFWGMLVAGLKCVAWHTHLFLIWLPHVDMLPTLWGTLSLSLLSVVCSLWLLYLLACQSAPSPKLEYMEISQWCHCLSTWIYTCHSKSCLSISVLRAGEYKKRNSLYYIGSETAQLRSSWEIVELSLCCWLTQLNNITATLFLNEKKKCTIKKFFFEEGSHF